MPIRFNRPGEPARLGGERKRIGSGWVARRRRKSLDAPQGCRRIPLMVKVLKDSEGERLLQSPQNSGLHRSIGRHWVMLCVEEVSPWCPPYVSCATLGAKMLCHLSCAKHWEQRPLPCRCFLILVCQPKPPSNWDSGSRSAIQESFQAGPHPSNDTFSSTRSTACTVAPGVAEQTRKAHESMIWHRSSTFDAQTWQNWCFTGTAVFAAPKAFAP